MTLDQAKIKQLRTIGHKLKPIVTLGDKGLSESVLAELERALDDHELIKVKLAYEDRDDRETMINEALKQTGAELIQKIGKVALICRIAKKTNKKLSNLHRPV